MSKTITAATYRVGCILECPIRNGSACTHPKRGSSEESRWCSVRDDAMTPPDHCPLRIEPLLVMFDEGADDA